jgi:hypothetical protein
MRRRQNSTPPVNRGALEAWLLAGLTTMGFIASFVLWSNTSTGLPAILAEGCCIAAGGVAWAGIGRRKAGQGEKSDVVLFSAVLGAAVLLFVLVGLGVPLQARVAIYEGAMNEQAENAAREIASGHPDRTDSLAGLHVRDVSDWLCFVPGDALHPSTGTRFEMGDADDDVALIYCATGEPDSGGRSTTEFIFGRWYREYPNLFD